MNQRWRAEAAGTPHTNITHTLAQVVQNDSCVSFTSASLLACCCCRVGGVPVFSFSLSLVRVVPTRQVIATTQSPHIDRPGERENTNEARSFANTNLSVLHRPDKLATTTTRTHNSNIHLIMRTQRRARAQNSSTRGREVASAICVCPLEEVADYQLLLALCNIGPRDTWICVAQWHVGHYTTELISDHSSHSLARSACS